MPSEKRYIILKDNNTFKEVSSQELKTCGTEALKAFVIKKTITPTLSIIPQNRKTVNQIYENNIVLYNNKLSSMGELIARLTPEGGDAKILEEVELATPQWTVEKCEESHIIIYEKKPTEYTYALTKGDVIPGAIKHIYKLIGKMEYKKLPGRGNKWNVSEDAYIFTSNGFFITYGDILADEKEYKKHTLFILGLEVKFGIIG